MFCAKTHNMGFVSPSDNKTPIVPLQGAALRECRKRQGGFAIRESYAHPLTHNPLRLKPLPVLSIRSGSACEDKPRASPDSG